MSAVVPNAGGFTRVELYSDKRFLGTVSLGSNFWVSGCGAYEQSKNQIARTFSVFLLLMILTRNRECNQAKKKRLTFQSDAFKFWWGLRGSNPRQTD